MSGWAVGDRGFVTLQLEAAGDTGVEAVYECVVVEVKKQFLTTIACLGATLPEGLEDNLATIETTVNGQTTWLLVVRGKPSNLLAKAPPGRQVQLLSLSNSLVFKAYYRIDFPDETAFATASEGAETTEDTQEVTRLKKLLQSAETKIRDMQASESDESGSEDAEQDEMNPEAQAVLAALFSKGKAKERPNGVSASASSAAPFASSGAGDTGGGSGLLGSSRFKLLQEEGKRMKKGSSAGNVDLLLDALGKTKKLKIQDVIQMELLKELRRGKGKKGSSDEDEDGNEELRTLKVSGVAKAIRNFESLKSETLLRPQKVIEDWLKRALEDLGVEEEDAAAGQPVNILDHHKKVGFGKQRLLHRTYVQDLHVLRMLLKGNPLQAAAQLCRNLESKHQCCLDDGNWRSAWLLTCQPDPLEKRRFGGGARSLEIIAGYQMALDKVQKTSATSPQEEGGASWKKQPWWQKKRGEGAAEKKED